MGLCASPPPGCLKAVRVALLTQTPARSAKQGGAFAILPFFLRGK